MSKRPRKPKHKFMDQFLPRQTRDAPGTPRNNSEMVSWSWGGSWMYWDGSPHLGTNRHRHFGIVKSWTVYYKLISVWLQPLIIHHHFHFANEKAKAHKKLNKFLAPGPTASIWKNKHLKSGLAVSVSHAISIIPCWLTSTLGPVSHPWGGWRGRDSTYINLSKEQLPHRPCGAQTENQNTSKHD